MRKEVITTFMLIFFLLSCNKSDINTELSNLLKKEIVIPEDKLKKLEFSYINDSLDSDKRYILLVFVDEKCCSPCEISNISNIEKKNRQDDIWQELKKIYVFNINPENSNFIYDQLYYRKIKSTVYIDTCGVFRETNSFIPESEMYHSFILNRKGEVLLVGNPFKNHKLKELLTKIVNNEMPYIE